MSEQELREALQVYAGPAVAPPGARDQILARVTARKRRFRVSAGIAAAAAAATVVAGGLMLRPDGGSRQPQPVDGWQPERTSNAPYEVPACSRGEVGDRLPDLADVTAVRFCSDSRSSLAGEPVAVEEGAVPHDPEGLVELDGFRRQVGGLPAAGPARCATISVLPTNDALMFVLADGSTVLVRATMCQDVLRGGTALDGQAVREAFVAALDEQRERVGYGRTVEGDVPCRPRGMAGPVRPGRERIVAGAACPDLNDAGAEPRQLTGAQVGRLAAAWREATVGEWRPDDDNDPCLDLDDEHPRVVARTDRGDVLTLTPSPCGFLFLDKQGEGHWRIPIALDELG